jgi:hypothetical protein
MNMSEKHSPHSQEKPASIDTIWKIGRMVMTGLDKIIDMFFPVGKK